MIRVAIMASIILTVFCRVVCNGQSNSLTGRVTDRTGTPLHGATVSVKGKGVKVQSDRFGHFNLYGIMANDTVVFANVGYRDTSIVFTGSETLSVEMDLAEGQIEVVEVSTGYQTIPKERAVGSFETIGKDRLDRIVSSNILVKLEGQSSLLFDKGEYRPSITIRGINTFEGNTDPLIILDNFPYDGPISSINPLDVENVTVLKDASAASIWGARASNGVIVIQTKKASAHGRQNINLSSFVQLQERPNLHYVRQIDSRSMVELEQTMFELGAYRGLEDTPLQTFLSPVVELLIANREGEISSERLSEELERYSNIDNRDQFRDLMYRNAVNQQYYLSFSESKKRSNYHVSIGMDNNTGSLSEKSERYSLRMNHQASLTKNVSWLNSVFHTSTHQRNGHTGYMATTNLFRPYMDLVGPEGEELAYYQVRKGYAEAMWADGTLLDWRLFPLQEKQYDRFHSRDGRSAVSSELRWNALRGLRLDLVYRLESGRIANEQLRGRESFYTRNLINTYTSIDGGNVTRNIPLGGIRTDGITNVVVHNWRGQVNYGRSWGSHSVHALGGVEIRTNRQEQRQAGVYGYDENTRSFGAVDYLNPVRHLLYGSNVYVPDHHQFRSLRNNFISGFVNFGYDFKGKYLFTFSTRRDASNNFGMSMNDRWNPMWSAGLGWNLQHEAFMPTGLFNTLKLRSTYGVTGNMDPSKSAVPVMTISGMDNLSRLPRGLISKDANNALKWESTKTLNTGLDFGLARIPITGSIEFYRKWNEDLFAPSINDVSNGATAFMVRNVGSMRAEGIESELNVSWLNRKNLTVETRFLYNYNITEVTSYYQRTDRMSRNNTADGTIIHALREGQPLYRIVSYPFKGLDTEGRMLTSLFGEETIDYAAVQTADMDNLVYSGSAVPVHFGNIGLNLRYRDWSFDAVLNWKAGYYFRRPALYYGPLLTQNQWGAGSADYAHRWQKPGDENITTVPRFEYPASGSDFMYSISETTVEPADHLRLQNLNIAYRFPSKVVSRISSLRIGLNIANLGLLWKKTTSGLDPDYPSTPPIPRSYSFIAQLQF